MADIYETHEIIRKDVEQLLMLTKAVGKPTTKQSSGNGFARMISVPINF